jgi:hypothetical protein
VVESFVIAELDQAIRGAAPNMRSVSMDRRVKPGGDDMKVVACCAGLKTVAGPSGICSTIGGIIC